MNLFMGYTNRTTNAAIPNIPIPRPRCARFARGIPKERGCCIQRVTVAYYSNFVIPQGSFGKQLGYEAVLKIPAG